TIYARCRPTCSYFFLCLHLSPSTSPLFPYTTLFRSPRSSPGEPRAFVPVYIFRKQEARTGDTEKFIPLPQYRVHIRHLADHRRRSEEHTSELQSPYDLVCRLLLEKKKKTKTQNTNTN